MVQAQNIYNFFRGLKKSEYHTNDAWISTYLTLARSDFSISSLVVLMLYQGVCSQDCQVPPQHIKHLFNHILVILRVFFQIKKWRNFGPSPNRWGAGGVGAHRVLTWHFINVVHQNGQICAGMGKWVHAGQWYQSISTLTSF